MYTYVDYKINQLNDDNKLKLNTDDIVAVNLTYRFKVSIITFILCRDR